MPLLLVAASASAVAAEAAGLVDGGAGFDRAGSLGVPAWLGEQESKRGGRRGERQSQFEAGGSGGDGGVEDPERARRVSWRGAVGRGCGSPVTTCGVRDGRWTRWGSMLPDPGARGADNGGEVDARCRIRWGRAWSPAGKWGRAWTEGGNGVALWWGMAWTAGGNGVDAMGKRAVCCGGEGRGHGEAYCGARSRRRSRTRWCMLLRGGGEDNGSKDEGEGVRRGRGAVSRERHHLLQRISGERGTYDGGGDGAGEWMAGSVRRGGGGMTGGDGRG
jgi:hypothetical protein